MAMDFQFAFLGYQHNYAASVTQVGREGHLIGSSIKVCYRLPEYFSDQYTCAKSKQHAFNVRGHDFLSHVGRWKGEEATGSVDASHTILGEIRALNVLAEENKLNGFKKADLNLSFGPMPGAFFADAFRLKRYRWVNLPLDLEDELQKELSIRGYGKIHDVAINASGGWVMQVKQGKQFNWGGQLPGALERALEGGKRRKATISRLYLNHQHSREYVLIFSDGQTHISLHHDFEEALKRLIQTWATHNKVKNLVWNFIGSCSCAKEQQSQLDAAYYHRRGLLQLSRGVPELALAYMREAKIQDPTSKKILANHAMALEAVRLTRNDPILELRLAQGNLADLYGHHDTSPAAAFRNEYIWMLNSEDVERTRTQLAEFRKSERGAKPHNREWSYALAAGEDQGPIEKEADCLSGGAGKEESELPGSPLNGRVHSHEVQ